MLSDNGSILKLDTSSSDILLFDVPIQNQYGILYLRLEIGSIFPDKHPILKIAPQSGMLSHPWIEPVSQHLSYQPSIVNWSLNSSLSRVCKEAIEEFSINPPLALTTNIKPVDNYSFNHNPNTSILPVFTAPVPPPSFSLPKSSPPKPPGYISSSASKFLKPEAPVRDLIPPFPTEYPELKDLSIAELKELEGQHLMDYSTTLGVYKNMIETVEKVEKEILSLSESNVAAKLIVEEKTADILSLSEKLSNVQDDYVKLYDIQQQLLDKISSSTVKSKANELINSADENAESLKRQFENGELSDTDFVKSYMAAKKLYYLRITKRDAL